MERRAFLAMGVGATAAAAGCLSRATSIDPEDESSPDETESKANDPASDDETERIESETTDRRTIGSGSLDGDGLRTPHAVALANRTDGDVEGTFTIRTDGDVAFEETVELEPGAVLSVSLTEFARYEVEASIPDAGAATTETVGLDVFDCNGGQTTIGLRPDETLESTTVSTRLACVSVEERVPAGESVEHVIGGVSAGEAENDDAKHALRAENPTEETWTVRAQLSEDAEAVFDGAFTLEPDAEAVLPIAESGDYEFLASVLETDAAATESVGADLFDCNSSSTTASVDAEGELDVQTISTLIACGVDDDEDDRSNGSD